MTASIAVLAIAAASVLWPVISPAAVADPIPPTSITLTTDKLMFDAGSTFTLTATVDQPLEDTNSTLTITDETNSETIEECTTGLICEVEISFSSGGPREYLATVNSLTSTIVEVARSPWTVALTTSLESRSGPSLFG